MSDPNWAVQPWKMARGLKFLITEEDRLYYVRKMKDQLRLYRKVDLCLCKKQDFSVMMPLIFKATK